MKKTNWVIDFLNFVEANKDKPFEWGVNDCVMFAADSVMLMGNEDPATESRGRYKTETGAKRHLASQYGDLYTAWDSRLERIENVNFVQNGDVVLFDGELGLTSAIYWNGGVFAPTATGIGYKAEMHSLVLAAWRV